MNMCNETPNSTPSHISPATQDLNLNRDFERYFVIIGLTVSDCPKIHRNCKSTVNVFQK